MTGHRCQTRNTREKEEAGLVSSGTEEPEEPPSLVETEVCL